MSGKQKGGNSPTSAVVQRGKDASGRLLAVLVEESVIVKLLIETVVVETTGMEVVATELAAVEVAAAKVTELVRRSGSTVPVKVVAAAEAAVDNEKVTEESKYQEISQIQQGACKVLGAWVFIRHRKSYLSFQLVHRLDWQ